MRKMFLAASVAALAISVPASAERGGNKEKGGAPAAQAQQGGGKQAKADRGGGQAVKVDRGGSKGQARIESRGGDQRMVRAERRNERAQIQAARVDRGKPDRAELRVHGKSDSNKLNVGNRGELKQAGRANVRMPDLNDVRLAGSGKARAVRVDIDNDDPWIENFARGVGGCPPGLANKNPLCMPPGQYKKLEGTLLPAAIRSRMLPDFLKSVYRDDDDYYYRWNEGLVYRVDRDTNLIASLLPLFGGGLTLGQTFPTTFGSAFMPSYYQPFYRDSADDYYRYNNGYMYEIDRSSGLIEDIIPLYDNGYGVGQMLPTSYSYYNLPDPYRSYYSDNDDYYYRYAPGAIYQVDRDTQLISAVASLLTGGLGVGQQLPLGYSAYNLPLSYRDQYYDTPDNWYRYSNGNIYQIDPTTQLITAVIAALV
ncbi:MAG TPA: hypothetical protein VFK50_01750 [Sphingomicrobium sp.]|nr:hypothetical protein [Sphingomicrobium sp.]